MKELKGNSFSTQTYQKILKQNNTTSLNSNGSIMLSTRERKCIRMNLNLHCFLNFKLIPLSMNLFYTFCHKSEYKLTTENLPSPNHMTHLVPSAARLRPVINQDTIRPGHQENPRNFPHTSSPIPKPRPSCNIQPQKGSTCYFKHFT